MCALVPGLSSLVLGVEVALIGLMLWMLVTILQYRAFAREFPRPLISIALAQVATILFCFAGISMATEALGGLYWLAPGIILSMTAGVSNAWVLLVEILR